MASRLPLSGSRQAFHSGRHAACSISRRAASSCSNPNQDRQRPSSNFINNTDIPVEMPGKNGLGSLLSRLCESDLLKAPKSSESTGGLCLPDACPQYTIALSSSSAPTALGRPLKWYPMRLIANALRPRERNVMLKDGIPCGAQERTGASINIKLHDRSVACRCGYCAADALRSPYRP